MPFDTIFASSDKHWIYPPPFASIGRFLFLNRLELGDVVTLASGDPNPSSELGHSPFRNVFSPDRSDLWQTSGMFVCSFTGTDGFEMGQNWRIRVTSATYGVLDLQLLEPLGTLTFYRTPHHIAAKLQQRLNEGGRSGYVVRYSDELTERGTGVAATYKFTVSHPTDTFSLDITGDDCWDTLGWPSGSPAAGSHTGLVRIHTEEWFTINMGASFLMRHGAESLNAKTYRWLALVDLNFWPQPAGVTHWSGNAAGASKVVVYFGGLPGNLDRQADTAFTYGVSMFQLLSDPGDATRPGAVGTWEGLSGGYHHVRTAPGAVPYHTCAPAHYWIVDLASWAGESSANLERGLGGWPPGNLHNVRVKIVNRDNPAGRMRMAHAFLGPGWYPARNMGYPYAFTPVDESLLTRTERGALRRTYRAPGRLAGMSWDRSIMTEAAREEIEQLGIRTYQLDPARGQLAINPQVGARRDRAMVFVDPGFPKDALANGDHWVRAAGAVYGPPSWSEFRERFRDQWLATLQVEEEAPAS